MEGFESSGVTSGAAVASRPTENNKWDVDIGQMRTQPTSQHELRLIYFTNGLQETATVGLHLRLGVFLALP